MELSPDQVLERAEILANHAGRIQELKERLLYVQTFGPDLAFLDLELERHDEIIAEIRCLYTGGIMPVVEELMAFLQAHPAELVRLLED